jgi:hypothetical protein
VISPEACSNQGLLMPVRSFPTTTAVRRRQLAC